MENPPILQPTILMVKSLKNPMIAGESRNFRPSNSQKMGHIFDGSMSSTGSIPSESFLLLCNPHVLIFE